VAAGVPFPAIQATSGEVAAPSGERQRRSACWAGTADEIGKRRRPRTVGVDAAPEFIPKRNSEPIVNRGRIADDATRLEIGDAQDASRLRSETRNAVGAVIRNTAHDTAAAPPAGWPLFRIPGREQQSPNRRDNAACRPVR